MVLFAKVVLSTLALLPFFCFYRKTFRTTLGKTKKKFPPFVLFRAFVRKPCKESKEDYTLIFKNVEK